MPEGIAYSAAARGALALTVRRDGSERAPDALRPHASGHGGGLSLGFARVGAYAGERGFLPGGRTRRTGNEARENVERVSEHAFPRNLTIVR